MRVAVAARTASQLEETVRLIEADGGKAIAVPTDVVDERAVAGMIGTVEEQLGEIDLLINCAGAGRPYGPTWEVDAGEWWRTVEVNLKGPFLCCAAVMRGMVARKRGRIVNVASGAGTVSIPHMSAYVTSKTALIRLTEVLADEAREHGVSVFAVQPGTVRTALAEDVLDSESARRWLPWFQTIFEKGRDVTAEPAVELVRLLASGAADGLSGRMFTVAASAAETIRSADEVKAGDWNVLRLRYFKP
jgi:NAD(P)-dependent dehydrogenase (short-subunit alcohol dehydrogenase family)